MAFSNKGCAFLSCCDRPFPSSGRVQDETGLLLLCKVGRRDNELKAKAEAKAEAEECCRYFTGTSQSLWCCPVLLLLSILFAVDLYRDGRAKTALPGTRPWRSELGYFTAVPKTSERAWRYMYGLTWALDRLLGLKAHHLGKVLFAVIPTSHSTFPSYIYIDVSSRGIGFAVGVLEASWKHFRPLLCICDSPLVLLCYKGCRQSRCSCICFMQSTSSAGLSSHPRSLLVHMLIRRGVGLKRTTLEVTRHARHTACGMQVVFRYLQGWL